MNDAQSVEYLMELYRQTNGISEKQVSMHDIGAAMGMEKTLSSTLAEDLIIDELVELKTLAGDVGITAKGCAMLQEQGMIQSRVDTPIRLSGERILTDKDRKCVETILETVRRTISQAEVQYEIVEPLVIDLKCVEVQLLSKIPKTAVVLALFTSMRDSLSLLDRAEPASLFDELLR